MITAALRIAALLACKLALPLVVGLHAIGHMTLDAEPALGERQHPVVGQGNTGLRDGTGIDAEGLRTGTQFLVFQLHGVFLATDGQHTLQPAHLGEGLLDDQRTGETLGHGDIKAIADIPVAVGTCEERTQGSSPHIAVGRLQRTQSVTVGIQPQWGMVAMRQRGLHLHLVVQAVQGRISLLCRC